VSPAPNPEEMLVRGWNVIPVRPDKRPAISSWKQFQRERVSVAQVKEWARKLRPKAWAVVTGKISSVVVLDFDGDQGNATLRTLGFAPHVRTGSGGHHVYFEHPGGRVPTVSGSAKHELARLYPGLDIRADGGYAIFTGANEAGEYEWLRQPCPEPFENLPAELRTLLKPGDQKAADNPPNERKPRVTPNGRVPAERLVSQALEWAGEGRNKAGFWLATQLRDNGYSAAEAEQAILDYANRVPGINSKGQPEPYSAAEARASLRQAYSRPAREPWMPGRNNHSQDEERMPPDLLSQLHNDHGNALRLIAMHGRDVRFCHPMRRWLIWDGKRWLISESGQAYKLSKETMATFLTQALKQSIPEAERFAKQSLDHKRITAMLASAECELPIKPTELDIHPYLLNCLNGTVDLQTGELRAHRRDDYITKLVHVEYRSKAECPIFLQFLRRIMGDGPDASEADGERAVRLVSYLQKVFGYSLTGYVSEKVIFCLFGYGNNGKTTLLEAVRFVLWEYAAQLQIDTLMSHRQRESNASLSDLADLRGARLVTTSEAEQGGRLAEGKLKYLSAGMGEIKTCRKYENPITFKATHKLFIDANHKPIIRGADQAIWNRLKLIPFCVTIPPDEIDKSLLEKLKDEAEGILAWIVEGCRRWRSEGLGDPPEVTKASSVWRSEMSLLKEFIEDCCEVRDDAFCPVAELRKAYTTWAEENRQKNPTWFSGFDDELIAEGCRKERRRIGGKQVRVWEGIQLIREAATADVTK